MESSHRSRPEAGVRVAYAMVALVFGVSAMAKGLHPEAIVAAMRFGAGARSAGAGLWLAIVTGGLVAWELVLACQRLRRPEPARWMARAASATLVMFTAFLAWLWSRPGAPSCGCSGLPSGLSHGSEAGLGVLRNAGLLLLPLYAGRRRGYETNRSPVLVGASGVERRAFSLVEVLVLIAVIGVLMTVMLPALSRSRATAREGRSLSDLRLAHVVLSLYAHGEREMFPFIGTPGRPDGPFHIHGHTLRSSGNGGFWGQATLWASVAVPEYAEQLPRRDATRYWNAARLSGEPASPPDWLIATPLLLSFSTMASREFWDNRWEFADIRRFRGTSWVDLAFPSLKGLLWDSRVGGYMGGPTELDSRFFTAWGDGSASFLRSSQMDPSLIAHDPYTGFESAIMNTYMGLSGIDRR